MRTIKTLIAGLILWIFFYLVGSFSQANFNISEWNSLFRSIYSICCGCISFITCLFVYGFHIDDDETFNQWLEKYRPNDIHKVNAYEKNRQK